MYIADKQLTQQTSLPEDPLRDCVYRPHRRWQTRSGRRPFCVPTAKDCLQRIHRFNTLCPVRLHVKRSPHRLQAHQQKSSTEVSAVDAPINAGRRHFDSQRCQSASKLTVSHIPTIHGLFEQQACPFSPQIANLDFCFFSGGLSRQVHRSTRLLRLHVYLPFEAYIQHKLKSILSHLATSYLYPCSHITKAKHA